MAYSSGLVDVYDFAANLPATAVGGPIAFAQDTNLFYQFSNGVWSQLGGGAPRITPIASSATPSINVATTSLFEITALALVITGFTIVGTPADGQDLDVRITGTGSRAITWGSSFLSSGTQTLLSTTATTKTHLSRFKWDAVKAAFVCWYVDATGY